jgi:hypothetical protein
MAVTAKQDNFIHSEEYIFTTEAHPLHIAAVQAGGFDKLHKNLKSSSTAVTKVHTVQSAELSAAVTGETATTITASNGTVSTVYTGDNVCGPVAVTPVQYYSNSSISAASSTASGGVVQDVAVVAVPRDPRYAATCARRDAIYMVSGTPL